MHAEYVNDTSNWASPNLGEGCWVLWAILSPPRRHSQITWDLVKMEALVR